MTAASSARLVFKHAAFCAAIGFERPMPVQVVLREVEQHGDIGAERGNRFELEAACFHHRETRVTRNVHARDQRRADISRDLHGKPRGFQDVTDERRVVVVLPFGPVMQIRRPRRNRQASSISLHTGTPIARAAASAGIVAARPDSERSDPVQRNVSGPVSTQFESDARGAQLPQSPRFPLRPGPLSALTRAHAPPRSSAVAMPVRANPHQHLFARGSVAGFKRLPQFERRRRKQSEHQCRDQNRTMVFRFTPTLPTRK